MLFDGTKALSNERHPFFGPNDYDWNLDLDLDDPDYGKPGIGVIAEAVSVWAALNGTTTIGQAAVTFKIPVDAIAQCIEHHPWMFFIKDKNTPLENTKIEHDGE